MLTLLQMENLAVIESAELSLGEGLTVLTGETGAGKSIVIDALHLVTGGRTGREIIRTGEDSASVTAVFRQDMPDVWYDAMGIERDPDGDLILFRRISADGKNVCRINGRPVTASQLREAGADLVDIHGQNDGRKLLDESTHLRYLDRYAGTDDALAAYRAVFSVLTEQRQKLKELDMDEGEKARTIDMLTFRIDEIERVSPKPGETEEIGNRRDLLKNAEKLMDSLNSAVAALHGGDRSSGAVALAEEAESELSLASRYTDRFQDVLSRITDARYALDDAASELADLRRELDFSPEELEELEERFHALRRLQKKYGPTEEDVLATLEDARRMLDELSCQDESRARLEAKIRETEAEAVRLASTLTEKRKRGAERLEAQIVKELSQLNMKGISFQIVFERAALGPNGADSVRFYMSANPGEEPGRISRIASGGELSRIMLAMKNVLAENDPAGTLVFDEVDAGVSGIAAQRVGEKLWTLGRVRQVLCVTHLPQIASMADTQFSVEKTLRDGRTRTLVTELDREGRKAELGRLSGGENVSETTLKSADEQIAAADGFKRRFGTDGAHTDR